MKTCLCCRKITMRENSDFFLNSVTSQLPHTFLKMQFYLQKKKLDVLLSKRLN